MLMLLLRALGLGKTLQTISLLGAPYSINPDPLLRCAAGAGQDAADDLAAGVPAGVSRHQRPAHGHRAQVNAAQLDERVQALVPLPARHQVHRQS